MDQKSIVRAVIFILAWVNTALVQNHLKTIPVLDQSQVALAVSLVVSIWGFVKHNFMKPPEKASIDNSVKE